MKKAGVLLALFLLSGCAGGEEAYPYGLDGKRNGIPFPFAIRRGSGAISIFMKKARRHTLTPALKSKEKTLMP